MTRVVALDDIDNKFKQQICSRLRDVDECIVLPQAHISKESGTFKNVIMRLDGSVNGLDPSIFNSNWFAGVSVVSVPAEKAEMILSSESSRRLAMQKLAESIPSELKDSETEVGPQLDGGDQDRDRESWECGFDGPGCCVGLYSALQKKSPDAHLSGMTRAHKNYYIVAKAGSGIAGQTFHARLLASLKEGNTLDDCLDEGGSPGAKALRRVAAAGKRNRGRIMRIAAESFGFHSVNTIGDNSSSLSSPNRIVVTACDVVYNAITRSHSPSGRAVWQYTPGCVEQSLSVGTVSSSNLSDGFILFTQPTGDLRFSVRNQAYNCIPFTSIRTNSNREVVLKAVDEYVKNMNSGSNKFVHPDHQWVHSHFAWCSKKFSSNQKEIEPSPLWGTHKPEDFVSDYGRELGLSKAKVVRLNPEAVAIAGVEPGKLRIAVKAISSAEEDLV